MTTKIIHTGRAGPDMARQRRTEPGRDGKGRTGRKRKTGPGRVGKCRAVLDSAEQDRDES